MLNAVLVQVDVLCVHVIWGSRTILCVMYIMLYKVLVQADVLWV
jgi:hypothetical protein